MKRLFLPTALILMLAGCFPPMPAPKPPTFTPTVPPTPTPMPIELVILHTNDTWGYIFPCG